MIEPNTDRYVWVDLETFGLDTQRDPILEVGFMITDIDLNIIDDHEFTVWTTPWYDTLFADLQARSRDGDKIAELVYNMHMDSGLWDQASTWGNTPEVVEANMADWLDGHGISKGDPLCGSTVSFDRDMLKSWMPKVIEPFSYRNIDVSSFKETCMRENPTVYAGLEKATQQKKAHRALSDIKDTLDEFAYYRKHFLKVQHL